MSREEKQKEKKKNTDFAGKADKRSYSMNKQDTSV